MLKYAEKHGCRVCDGMGMLIGQGIKAVEIWLDTSLSKDLLAAHVQGSL